MKTHGFGVDWLRPGPFTPDERAAVQQWYADLHGEGNLDLSPFLTFWFKHDEEVFKRYRRLLEAAFISGGPTHNVHFMMFLHTYVILGWKTGVLYEVIGSHKSGVTKREILDTIALAFIHAGPMGMSATAEVSDAYLEGWKTDEAFDGDVWPKGWKSDGDLFKAGLDFATEGLTGEELRRLEQWHERHEGQVPSYVRWFGKWNPEALKALRARYEGAVQAIPKQLVPLLALHSALMLARPDAMRRAMHQARYCGVSKAEMMEVVTFGLLYLGHLSSDVMTDAISDAVESWDE